MCVCFEESSFVFLFFILEHCGAKHGRDEADKFVLKMRGNVELIS